MTVTAKVYGGSLYDLAAEEQLTDILIEQMKEIRAIFRENPDYIKLLMEPSIPKHDRIGLIEEAFGTQAERYLVNFLKLLCERGILGEFSGCLSEFQRRYYEDKGIAEAFVTSAVALEEPQAEALKQRLEKISGKQIILVQKVDPLVIGGLRVEIEGRQLDGTLSGRMSGLSKKLNEIIV